MGTTSPKNLRYPEPTTEARTLHTQIKNLADDGTTVLTAHDARFAGLDSKTNTTDSILSLRGNPVWKYSNCAGVFTHSPNDGVNRTISQHTDQFYVNPAANYIMVSLMQASFGAGAGGTAGYWEPLVNFGGTGWQFVGASPVRAHNNEQTALDLGFFAASIFDARSYRNMAGSVASNFVNDPTSAGWVTHGYLRWSVVSFT